MLRTKSCPSDETLRAISVGNHGEMSSINVGLIENHLKSCPLCWARTRVFAEPRSVMRRNGLKTLDLLAV